MAELVMTAGTPAFERALFTSARAATQCEHLTAYSFSPTHRPQLVVAANPGERPIAREAGIAYVTRFWNNDPGNRVLLDRGAGETGMVLRVSGDEIRNAPFRQGCYGASAWQKTGHRMVDRVSIVKRQRERFVKISFHRAEGAGLFSDSEVDGIVGVADLLTALVARHDASLPDPQGTTTGCEQIYLQAALSACPQLTAREAEICAQIVLGMTSEGMSLALGISVNTVRTYRKRAYTRLNISSQNELMKLVLPHLGVH